MHLFLIRGISNELPLWSAKLVENALIRPSMGLVVIDDSESLVLVVDSRDVADLDDLVLYLALWYSRGVYFLIEHLLWTLILLL